MRKLALTLTLASCTFADVEKAKRFAQDFSKNIPGATGVDCNDSDSDGDGYVSCTVFRGDKEPIAISCGAENYCACNCAKGCKLTPARMVNQ